MANSQELPIEQKLTVIVRVEPGCLGPDGKDHIEDFCQYTLGKVVGVDAEFVHWDITPRYDKALPELEYKIHHKKLPTQKASRYLEIHQRNIDDFEDELHTNLEIYIGEFLKH